MGKGWPLAPHCGRSAPQKGPLGFAICTVMYLTKRIVSGEMPFLWILLIRCSLTVCLMCPAMSLIASLLFKDYSSVGLIATWLQTAALNFPMALAWQIFFGGPLGRLVFRLIFRRNQKDLAVPDAEDISGSEAE